MQTTWVSMFVIVALVLGLGGTLGIAAPPLKEDALAGVTQNWDKNLPSASRFTVLTNFGGAAVRDNETGLVWEQAPLATRHIWHIARHQCSSVREIGLRKAWRLPSLHELASLIDTSVAFPGPKLPPGHPFQNVQGTADGNYWTATTDAILPESLAWIMNFGNGLPGTGGKGESFIVWCVRGPMNADAY